MFITEVRLEGDLYWKQILETNVNITRYSTTPPTTTPKLGFLQASLNFNGRTVVLDCIRLSVRL